MNLNVGIIHLPNAGSTTLLNLLSPTDSKKRHATDPSFFTTMQPQSCSVDVSNEITQYIVQHVLHGDIDQFEFTSISYFSFPALIHSHPLSSPTISALANMDVILYLLRAYDNSLITHYYNLIDPREEFKSLYLELAQQDLYKMKNIIQKNLRHKSQENLAEIEILVGFWNYMSGHSSNTLSLQDILTSKMVCGIQSCMHLNQANWSAEEQRVLVKYDFLTWKSCMCLMNVNELMYLRQRSPLFDQFMEFFGDCGIRMDTYLISLDFEVKFQKFDSEEFRLANPNLQSLLPRIHQLVIAAHHSIHFYTVDSLTRRASMMYVHQGTTAVEAAALVHQDVSAGFIAAEVLSFEDLAQHGDWESARLFGKVRQVGKRYELNDGDLVQFVYRAPPPASELTKPHFNRNSCPVLRS